MGNGRKLLRRCTLTVLAGLAVAAATPPVLPPFDEPKIAAMVNVDPDAARAAAAPYIADGARAPAGARAAALRITAISYAVQGHIVQARAMFKQSYDAATAEHDLVHMASAMVNIGTSWLQAGDYAHAIDAYRRGAVLAARSKSYGFHGNALANLSQAMADLGDPENALMLNREAETLYARGDKPVPPAAFIQRASMELQLDRPKAALADLDHARAILPSDDVIYTGDLEAFRAQALTRLGRIGEAKRALAHCFALARAGKLESTEMLCEQMRAELAIAVRQPAEARTAIAAMMTFYHPEQTHETGTLIIKREEARLNVALARLLGRTGEADREMAKVADFDKRILNYRQRVQLAVGALEMQRQGKDLRIELLEARNANLMLRDRQQTILVAGGFTGLLAISGAVFWRYRSRQARMRREQRLEERTRIARDLHDTLLQEMAGTQLALGAVTCQAQTQDSPLADTLVGITTQVSRAMVSARNTVWRMRNDDVDRGDLVGAVVTWLDQAHADRRDIIHLDVSRAPRQIEAEKAEHLLRIIQEGVGNALRHASPSRIDVTIEARRQQLNVSIVDDGIGFPTDGGAARQGAHWGLIGLGERADRLGALLKVQSAPGEGTRLLVTVPA